VLVLPSFKGQANWREILSRFQRGGGTLYDLEFLTDATGRRVAAYGYHAGYAGAATALMVWEWQLEHGKEPFPALSSYQNENLLIEDVRSRVKAGAKKLGRLPQAIVIGALGRCGRGAVDLLRAAGLAPENLLEWDMAETAPGGPFKEIVESDIFVNCIYLTSKIPPFIDLQSLDPPSRKLSVVCDVILPSRPPLPVHTKSVPSFSRYHATQPPP
jgi:saccharopine dehydrogenase (NAD+, L-lysine forming)